MRFTFHQDITQFKIISLIFATTFLCLFVYWPGLNGGFLVDDIDTLKVVNNYGGVTDFKSFLHFVFGNSTGTLGRPVAVASFLINDQFWPGDPRFFKYTNLLIHITIGLLLFIFASRLLKARKNPDSTSHAVAFLVSAIWLVHPLNVSTTLYVVQRMTQLMMLFSLLALLCYLIGRVNVGNHKKTPALIMSGGLIVFGSLSVLSKENGVLVLLYIAIIEYTLFRYTHTPKWYKIWFTVFIITPIALMAMYFLYTWSSIIGGYQYRDFSLIERLTTETRILCEYLYLILVPQIGGTGLVHDDIAVSTGLFSPFTTLLSILTIVSLLIAAFKLKKQYPVFSLGVFWFFGGHILESTFIPLELYFEHRNYLPMVGPIFALSYYFYMFGRKCKKKLLSHSISSFPLVVFIVSCLLTYQSSTTWASPFELYSTWATEHPNSLRAQRTYAHALVIANRNEAAIDILDSTFVKHPYDISLIIAVLNTACIDEQRPPYSTDEIQKFARNARYTGGLLPTVETFIDLNLSKSCPGISRDEVHSILTILESIHGFNGPALANFLFLHAEIYAYEKQLSPAVELLDKAFLHQKVATIPVRQARLLASAGLYKEALHYITLAKKVEGGRNPLLPSQMHIIDELEAGIITVNKENL